MKRVLVTGAGGFLGAHVVEHLLYNTDWIIAATDSFRHKGKTDRLTGVLSSETQRERIDVVIHDFAAPVSDQMAARIGDVDYVLALASASHVDRSITDPADFMRNNSEVGINTLEYVRRTPSIKHLIWISTDEVYGPVRKHDIVGHSEWAPILPSNPYSASKAAQEAIAFSYWRTYGVPLTIVNCMNLIGERQDPEKYLPSLIANISTGKMVNVHGTADEIGTRHYLHARNLADALMFLVQQRPHRYGNYTRPARYNVVGPDRVNNLELAMGVAAIMKKSLNYQLVDFHSTRPGHDPHYGLNPEKLTKAGWTPPLSFDKSLERTVRWTLDHPEWML